MKNKIAFVVFVWSQISFACLPDRLAYTPLEKTENGYVERPELATEEHLRYAETIFSVRCGAIYVFVQAPHTSSIQLSRNIEEQKACIAKVTMEVEEYLKQGREELASGVKPNVEISVSPPGV